MTPYRPAIAVLLAACVASAASLSGQQFKTARPLQWRSSVGPVAGNAKALVQSGSGTLFAYVNSEIYRSNDDGVSWNRCESQPSNREGDLVFERTLLAEGRRLYASTASGGPFYVTDDECVTSRPIPTPPGTDFKQRNIAVIDGVVVVALEGPTLFASSNEGRTWERRQTSLPAGGAPRLATRNGSLFLMASQQLFRSTDHGQTWSQLALNGPRFDLILTGGDAFYATASGGLWRSTDDGQTWTQMLESGLTAATVRGSRVYAAVFHPVAIARSDDGGKTWSRSQPPLRLHGANALLETGRGALLSATGAGIYRSTDKGAGWAMTQLHGQRILSLVAGRGRAYASLADASLWTSIDSGLTWSRVEWSRVDDRRQFVSPAAFSQLLLVDDRQVMGSNGRELLTSSDSGVSWSAAGLTKGVNTLVRLGDTWFAGTSEGVFRSRDLRQWSECSSGLPSGPLEITSTPRGDLIAFNGFMHYRSQDECGSWWPMQLLPLAWPARFDQSSIHTSDLAVGTAGSRTFIAQLSLSERRWNIRAESPDRITALAGDAHGGYWLATRNGVVRLSTDRAEWRLERTGLDGDVSAVAIDPAGYLLAAVTGRGIFHARLP